MTVAPEASVKLFWIALDAVLKETVPRIIINIIGIEKAPISLILIGIPFCS